MTKRCVHYLIDLNYRRQSAWIRESRECLVHSGTFREGAREVQLWSGNVGRYGTGRGLKTGKNVPGGRSVTSDGNDSGIVSVK
jgi:hypothetical protein